MHQKKKNPTLPFDLIVGILLRLPVRSLLRFKCVCKSWLSLISDPQFAKSHFDLAASPTHRILTNSTRDGHKIKSLDFEASFHDDSAIINLNIPAPLLPGGAKYPKVLDSCRGFVLLANREVELIVWNPLTGVYKRIPNLLYYETCHFLYGIGYDSSMDDYLVVFMQLIYPGQKLHYFSLKTNAWSDAQYIDVQYACISFGLFLNGAGLFLNGALHWLFLSLHTLLYVIIVFDLMERSLSEIPLPHDLDMVITSKDYYLRVMGECLGLCYLGVGYTEIWVMKEYKVHSSWTKSFVFSTYDIPRNIFLPICITKCGEIFGSNGWRTLVKVNDRGKLLEHGTYMQETGIFSQLHYHIYRESLLSLPSYSEEASKNDQQ